jgi:hypothetical protein
MGCRGDVAMVIGIGEGAATFGVLKSAYELVRDLRKSSDPATLKAGLEELADRLLAAREDALKAAEAIDALSTENKRLQSELEKRQSWEEEAKRYELREITPRSFAYVLKTPTGDASKHLVCPTCFEQNKRRILQQRDNSYSVCPDCATVVQDVPDRFRHTRVETDY